MRQRTLEEMVPGVKRGDRLVCTEAAPFGNAFTEGNIYVVGKGVYHLPYVLTNNGAKCHTFGVVTFALADPRPSASEWWRMGFNW